MSSITPRRLAELHAGDPQDLLDVRTPAEFREVHAEYAVNLPLDRLDPKALMATRPGPVGDPLYVICRTGGRGERACAAFHAAGFANVVNVEGGTQAWVEYGLPVVRGRAAVSLERQVRIVAGALVLAGVALAWLVHPGFVGLSAFVGAGLVFAGVTDTCTMGLVLARMPWNRVRGTPPQAR